MAPAPPLPLVAAILSQSLITKKIKDFFPFLASVRSASAAAFSNLPAGGRNGFTPSPAGGRLKRRLAVSRGYGGGGRGVGAGVWRRPFRQTFVGFLLLRKVSFGAFLITLPLDACVLFAGRSTPPGMDRGPALPPRRRRSRRAPGGRSALRRQRCQGLPWQTRARQLYRRRAPAVGVFAKHRLRGGVVGQLGGASWRRVPRRGGVGGKAEAGGREPEGESGAPPPASANAHASSPSTFSVDGF